MPLIDMPTPPTQTAPITVRAIQDTSPRQVYGKIEVCYLSPTAEQIENTIGLSHPSLSPRDMANNIFWDGSHSQIFHMDYENASVAVLQPPEHGKISEDLSAERDIRYYPDDGYSGDDKVVFLANIEGYEILVMYSIKVNTRYYSDANANPYSTHCPTPNWWQVLSPGSGETSPSPAVFHGSTKAGGTVGFLPATILGQAIGQYSSAIITLSTAAAGYGWFIDLTPTDNAGFVPTKNPLEWIAQPGSEAKGRTGKVF